MDGWPLRDSQALNPSRDFSGVRLCADSTNVDVEVLLYVHRNHSLLGTGAQDVHLDFHTAHELCYRRPSDET